MTSERGTRLTALAIAAALLAAPHIAAAQAEPIKGMISGRDGDRIRIKGEDGSEHILTLTPSTEVVAISGALKLQRDKYDTSVLITGLPVTVDTTTYGDKTYAVTVKYKAGDMKTAKQIQAGTATVEAQNRELRQRLSEANQYDVMGEATVLFATGSAALSEKAKADLKALGAKAKGIKGYLISVVGYADPTGNAAANQRLSYRRSVEVTRYLQKYCGVLPQRVMAADSMGDSQLIGDTKTPEGLAQNRRVEVKILTNKGLQGL